MGPRAPSSADALLRDDRSDGASDTLLVKDGGSGGYHCPPSSSSFERRGSWSSSGRRHVSGRKSSFERLSLHFVGLSEPPELSARDDGFEVIEGCDSDNPPKTFFRSFASSRGAPQVLFLNMLLAFALGSTMGVVPAIVTDKYARLNHGYDGDVDCSQALQGPADERPEACLGGSDDAQNASAMASFASNGMTFLSSAVVGSISDQNGRRGECVCA